MRERLEQDQRLRSRETNGLDFSRGPTDKEGERGDHYKGDRDTFSRLTFQNEFAQFSPGTEDQRSANEKRSAHFLGRPRPEVMPSTPRLPPSEVKVEGIKFPPISSSDSSKFPTFPEMDLRFPGSSQTGPHPLGPHTPLVDMRASFPGGPPHVSPAGPTHLPSPLTPNMRDIERDMRAYEGSNGCEARPDSPYGPPYDSPASQTRETPSASQPFVVQLPDSGPVFPGSGGHGTAHNTLHSTLHSTPHTPSGPVFPTHHTPSQLSGAL